MSFIVLVFGKPVMAPITMKYMESLVHNPIEDKQDSEWTCASLRRA